MHVITILYPQGDDTKFDMDYYTGTHMPMFADRLGDNCLNWGASAAHGNDYHCVGWAVVSDMAKFGEAMNEHGGEVMSDVANYTDATPILITGDITGGSDTP